jgi:hypothetical protein
MSAREGHDLDPVEARSGEDLGGPFGGALDLHGIEAGGRDPGNARQIDELRDRLVEAAVEGLDDGLGRTHLLQSSTGRARGSRRWRTRRAASCRGNRAAVGVTVRSSRSYYTS